jgi:hypothetical protein
MLAFETVVNFDTGQRFRKRLVRDAFARIGFDCGVRCFGHIAHEQFGFIGKLQFYLIGVLLGAGAKARVLQSSQRRFELFDARELIGDLALTVEQ